MRRIRKRTVVAGLVFVVAFLGGMGFYLYYAGSRVAKQIGELIVRPGPAGAVDPQEWKKLHIEMTQEQVVRVLGEAPHRSKIKALAGGPYSKEELARWEYWEYGYSAGLLAFAPHECAYAVYFDRDGKVSFFREPIREETCDGDGNEV